jgi:hypothetical protein
MSSTFVQVPPQSTGKRVATVARSEIVYDNLTAPISVRDVITGATSAGILLTFGSLISIGLRMISRLSQFHQQIQTSQLHNV